MTVNGLICCEVLALTKIQTIVLGPPLGLRREVVGLVVYESIFAFIRLKTIFFKSIDWALKFEFEERGFRGSLRLIDISEVC